MNIFEIREYDRSNMLDLIIDFPAQVRTAWQNVNRTSLPPLTQKMNQIVVSGMGGSAIGGDLLAGLLVDVLPIPVYVNRDYALPRFVDEHTLFIASSYSGDSEETVSALQTARSKNAHIICVSSGGMLADFAQTYGCGFIKVAGGQPPRTALGHMFFSMLGILQSLGFAPHQDAAVNEVIELSQTLATGYRNYENAENPALKLAHQLKGRIPIIYGAREPNAALPLRWRNQLSENAKVLAFSNLMPEMNHNDIVGWHSASFFLRDVTTVFLMDGQISKRIKARVEITQKIIKKQNADIITVQSSGISRLARTFSLLALVDFASFYLAILNKVDPTDISNIDFLKNKLAQM